MNKLLLCLLFVLASLTCSSQKVYFIYLQTESEQPFFVKMSGSIHSSSLSGYLILSKLRDSTYNFTIGFPQNKWPEQNFSVITGKKDHGFLLKHFDEKGWGLFDLQSLKVQMAEVQLAKIEEKQIKESKEVSAFTEILSKATDDPSLKEKPVIAKEDPGIKGIAKNEETKSGIQDTLVIKPVGDTLLSVASEEESSVEINKQEIANVEESKNSVIEQYKPSVVIKKSESSTTEGFGLVFIDDMGNGTNDTIRLVIPNPKPMKVPVAIREEPMEEKKFIEISVADTVKKEEVNPVETKPIIKDTSAVKTTLSNKCADVAVEADFFKLRKQMAAAENEDDMIDEAKKYFKLKCFSTVQIKNLSPLFLTEEGKYKFFDTAYSYVTDAENFTNLQSELKDEYYINRFRAMLRN
jgi:hypothetical protein